MLHLETDLPLGHEGLRRGQIFVSLYLDLSQKPQQGIVSCRADVDKRIGAHMAHVVQEIVHGWVPALC